LSGTLDHEVENGKATNAGEAVWKKSPGRLSPVGDVSVEHPNADDADDDSQIDDGKYQIYGRRYLQIIRQRDRYTHKPRHELSISAAGVN